MDKSIILLFQKEGGSRLSIRALASMGSIPWAMKASILKENYGFLGVSCIFGPCS